MALRAVSGFVEAFGLSALHAAVRSLEGAAGHPAADPKILASPRLHPTLRGVGSARELARLRGEHVAYQRLCEGGGGNRTTSAWPCTAFRITSAAPDR